MCVRTSFSLGARFFQSSPRAEDTSVTLAWGCSALYFWRMSLENCGTGAGMVGGDGELRVGSLARNRYDT